MNEKTLLFGFGTDEEHCEADTFETVEALLEYAQASWDEKDGNPFDEDCDYSGYIYVGTAEHFDIPCTMTCSWFGLYDLKEHKWAERYAGFSNYVTEDSE